MRGRFSDCPNMLKAWKNVSCLTSEEDAFGFISENSNPDGTPMFKIANPPIYSASLYCYLFEQNSPYAMKFLEILRRIRKIDLLRWQALIAKHRKIINIPGKIKLDDNNIDWKQLMIILCFGLSISSLVFIIELLV